MSHKENARLITALANCAASCDHCAIACLNEENVDRLIRCIKLDIDCAEICRLSIGFVSRGSEHSQQVLEECAELCEACAEECERHADMHDHCKECADACRSCADACRQGNF